MRGQSSQGLNLAKVINLCQTGQKCQLRPQKEYDVRVFYSYLVNAFEAVLHALNGMVTAVLDILRLQNF
jgi:hypothetical protein